MTTNTVSREEVLAVVEERLNTDIRVHRKFASDNRLSQENRDKREHWAECLEDTRDETLDALRALPAPPPQQERSRLWRLT